MFFNPLLLFVKGFFYVCDNSLRQSSTQTPQVIVRLCFYTSFQEFLHINCSVNLNRKSSVPSILANLNLMNKRHLFSPQRQIRFITGCPSPEYSSFLIGLLLQYQETVRFRASHVTEVLCLSCNLLSSLLTYCQTLF